MRFRPRVLVAGAGVVLVGLTFGSAWTATGLARDAIVREVQHAERLAANERGAELDSMLRNVDGLLGGLVRRPSFQRSFLGRDALALEADLSSAIGQRGLIGATVVDRDDVPLATVGAGPDEGTALLQLRTEIVDGGELRTQFVLDELLPRVVAPLDGFEGAVTLVHQDGTVLATGLPGNERRIEAPEVERALRTGGTIAYWSPVLGEDRIAAVRPLSSQPWALVVSAPAEGAHRAAVGLVRRLSIVLGATAVIAAAIVSMLVLGLSRSSRHAHRQRVEAETVALTDPLTGLANRRRLEQAVAEYAADGEEVTLLLVDVDQFKVLNDELGHVAGDGALRLVALALSGSVRNGDLVVRWGGDEFAVLLGASATAVTTLGRVRACVDAIHVPDFGPLRCSLGVAHGPADLNALLQEADASLYADKRQAAAAR